ncbi:hypothetical protein NKG94_11695 [Micromonospora sp. M12]
MVRDDRPDVRYAELKDPGAPNAYWDSSYAAQGDPVTAAPTATGTAIGMSELTVRFTSRRSQTTALDDVSLDIEPGSSSRSSGRPAAASPPC